MKNKRFKWLCYGTGVLLAIVYLAVHIQMNRYEETKRIDVRYDKLKNELVVVEVRKK